MIYGTIIAFELQQLIWIKVLWAYPPRSEANHRSIRYSHSFLFNHANDCELTSRFKRGRS